MIAAGPGAPAVRVRGLTKRYGETLALDEIDLELQPGELHGLLGLNGAGKTTLLRALFGLIRPDAGTIELAGRAAGFVEEPAFYPYLSGRGNLRLLAELDEDIASSTAAVEAALDRVGLSERAGERVSAYSTGMRQRLGIAAALIRRPRLLLLDEPTSGLDPSGVRAVSALLRELTGEGVAVLLSSHLIGELEALCHTYTILRAGRVVWDGPASEIDAEGPGSAYALSTSDDERAAALAGDFPDVRTAPADDGRGLRVTARAEGLDAYVVALGRDGVAIRRLELVGRPLERLFFERVR